jgi:hypothetical protein
MCMHAAVRVLLTPHNLTQDVTWPATGSNNSARLAQPKLPEASCL